jgi:M6 family metalloprotease-like protein
MRLKLSLLAIGVATLATVAATDAADNRTEQRKQAAASDAKPLQGRLEVIWGDGRPGPNRKSKNIVRLVEDNGRRHLLDPIGAKQAAGDLHGLANRRVAVSLAPESRVKTSGMSELLVPEVIVPIDDLANGGGISSKAGDISTRAVTGTKAWITVMCKFNNVATEPKPKSYFVDMYANVSGRLDHYWRQVSHQNTNVAGSNASGWHTLPQSRTYYFPSGLEPRWDDLTKNCLAAANPSVNYAGYFGINMVFNGELDGNAWGGSETHTLDGVTKAWPITWNPPWAYMNVPSQYSGISTIAHEMGHAYGLPHSNNSDGDGDTYDNPWDIMSGGWDETALDPAYGLLPQHPISYQRNLLGWVAAARLRTHNYTTATTTYTLDRASLQTSTNVLLIKLMVPGSTDYYTVEARKLSGGIYESKLPGDAVIIHSVKSGRDEPAWIVDAASPASSYSDKESNMFKVNESWTTPEPAGKRFKIEVLTATQSGFTVRVSSL